jgi:RNA polymerase sigma-70 factor (ECF subfamily)
MAVIKEIELLLTKSNQNLSGPEKSKNVAKHLQIISPKGKIPTSQSLLFGSLGTLNFDNSDFDRLPDNFIWESFKKGNELAFLHIYKSYFKIIYDYGCRFSFDQNMVKDCLQDFFLYMQKNKIGFGETNSIKLYLLKSFKRRVIDYHKKYHREYDLKETFYFSKSPIEVSCESFYINQQEEAKQLKKLHKALGDLDSKTRKAIYYYYFKGLSYKQLSKIFNFSHISSARRLTYRGLSQLRKLLIKNKD